jgi:hypothetical protein
MPKIGIQVEAQMLLDRGVWDDYCEKYGINVWAINEGLMRSNEMLNVSLADAKRWGLLKDEEEEFKQVRWGT